jgi:CHAT domain-containing protein
VSISSFRIKRPIATLRAIFIFCMIAAYPLAVQASGSLVSNLLGLGEAAFRNGDFAQAIEHWSRATAICRVRGDDNLTASTLAKRGEAHQRIGALKQAIKDLDEAMVLASNAADARTRAAYQGALGNTLLLDRSFEKAREHLASSLETARHVGDPQIRSASANNLGNLMLATGRLRAAAALYQEARLSAETANDPKLQSVAGINQARALSGLDQVASAIEMLEDAFSLTSGQDDTADKSLALIGLARVALTVMNQNASERATAMRVAYGALIEAARISETLDDPRGLSLANGTLGQLYLLENRRDEATQLTERALHYAQLIGAPEHLFRWEWQLARLAKATGKRAKALAAYRRALHHLRLVRQDIPVQYRDGRSSFREEFGNLYIEHADLLLADAEIGDETASQALLLEARESMERLKAVELQDYFNDPCVSRQEDSIVALESADSKTAVLYPIVLQDRISILVSHGPQIRQYVSPVDRAKLTGMVLRLRTLLEKRTTRQYRRPAKRIHDWLIGPIEQDLNASGITTLVFVPDGPLRTIPIAALYDGKRHLAEKFAVAIAPGLKLVDPQETSNLNLDALVSGVSESVQGFSELTAVRREVSEIGRMLNGKAMINEEFLASAFEREARSGAYNILHIASHAVFSRSSGDSFVLTFDDKLNLDRLESIIKFRKFDERPIELLTLSACTTASGDDRAALGLAGVALKSGARSALASLWSVNDEASAELINMFYEALTLSGTSKASALSGAQRRLMKDRRFRHPFFWSAFLVIGNWL